MRILALTVRVVTVPPFAAIMLAVSLFLSGRDDFGGPAQLGGMILWLAVVPALAYPCQPLVPGFKGRGREGQRSLAFITSAIGYVGGLITAIISKAPKNTLVVYCTYIVSVLFLIIFNKLTRFRASGHACGIAGPLVAMVWFIGPLALAVCGIFAAMMWASVKNKAHTAMELILGACISVAAFAAVMITSKLVAA